MSRSPDTLFRESEALAAQLMQEENERMMQQWHEAQLQASIPPMMCVGAESD